MEKIKIFEDCFNRSNEFQIIYEYILNNKDKKEPICFAVDGTWGQGKSWLIEKIEAKLKGINIENQYSKNDLVKYTPKDFFVFKYNAWEMDYYDDPLIGIVLTLCEQLNNLSTLTLSNAINKSLINLIKISVQTLGDICGNISKKLIGTDVIKTSKKAYETIKEFKESGKIKTISSKSTISTDIEMLLRVLTKLSEYKKIIFIVDEIDRCLPDYAIKTLERLHHIFSKIDNSLTIISTDSIQLHKSIQQSYGDSIDAKKYLEKFIMFSFNLGLGKLEQSEFEKRLEELKNKLSCKQITSNKWDIITNLLETYNARTKELIIKRCIMSLSLFKSIDNEYLDEDLLVGCVFISTINYEKNIEKKFFSANCSPFYGNDPKLSIEKYLKQRFIDAIQFNLSLEEQKIWLILLYIFTKCFSKDEPNVRRVESRIDQLNDNVKEEILKKSKFLEAFNSVNMILR